MIDSPAYLALRQRLPHHVILIRTGCAECVSYHCDERDAEIIKALCGCIMPCPQTSLPSIIPALLAAGHPVKALQLMSEV